MSNINLIVALCKKTNGIGFQGLIPWFLKNDLKHFQKITSNKNIYNFVIMGRKTWESIPDNKKPLRDRINIVLSKSFTKEQCQKLKIPEEFAFENMIELNKKDRYDKFYNTSNMQNCVVRYLREKERSNYWSGSKNHPSKDSRESKKSINTYL